MQTGAVGPKSLGCLHYNLMLNGLEKPYHNCLQNKVDKKHEKKVRIYSNFHSILASLGGSWASLGHLLVAKKSSFFYERPNIVPKRASSADWDRFWKDLGGSWDVQRSWGEFWDLWIHVDRIFVLR